MILYPLPKLPRVYWVSPTSVRQSGDGYFASTVGKHGDEGMIAKYVKNQGNEYLKLHRDEQLALF